MPAFVPLVVSLWLSFSISPQADQGDCSPWQTCRQLAVEAADRGDFEAFHTIAWRTVQTGPRNDPDLMYLLARAQSLSGRPHDALVMLRRLAEGGVARLEAETLEDFRRVRSLPEWTTTLEMIRNAGTAPVAAAAATSSPAGSSTSKALSKPTGQEARSVPETAPAKTDAGLPLPAAVKTPVALAYDAVSGRLVIADEESDTLKILSELSGTAVDLVSRGWAGAYRTTAIAIDGRRGDLWVAGADESTGQTDSALHRVQLISGRLLYSVSLPEDAGATKFGAVALSANSAFVLDLEGRRVFELVQGAKALQPRMAVTVTEPLGLAVSGNDVAFVSHPGGILRLDLVRRRSAALTVEPGVDIRGLQWLEHYKDSLLAIQQRQDGSLVAVRIRLDRRGRRAKSLELIGTAASRAATVMNGALYYLEDRQGGRVVRLVPLK